MISLRKLPDTQRYIALAVLMALATVASVYCAAFSVWYLIPVAKQVGYAIGMIFALVAFVSMLVYLGKAVTEAFF